MFFSLSLPVQYWQVSSVVLKALGMAATESNKDSSRIVRTLCCCGYSVGGVATIVTWVQDSVRVACSLASIIPLSPHSSLSTSSLLPLHFLLLSPPSLPPPSSLLQGRMVDFVFSGLQIMKVKINCFFLDQVRTSTANFPHSNSLRDYSLPHRPGW